MFVCVCEREKGFCYLSGTVISWALLSWLDPAPAVLSTQWMISCPPLEGKSWFFFFPPSQTAHPPKSIVLLLCQFSSQYLSHLISFNLFHHFIFIFSFFIFTFLCLSLFITLTSFEQQLPISKVPICAHRQKNQKTKIIHIRSRWSDLNVVCSTCKAAMSMQIV